MGLLSSVTTEAPKLPSRVVLYAPEKAGKTSFGCHAPKPVFLMTKGETGLLSLIEAAEVPPTAHFPNDFHSFADLQQAVRELIHEKHDYKTLVLDTGNGAEQLLLADVCANHFRGDVSEFNSYGRGLAAAVPAWADFLTLLDTLRIKRKMAVLFLHHSRVKSFQNPTGKDYDQWKPEAVDKLWSLTHKWADVIAFYGSRVKVYDDKAQSDERYLRCAPSAAIVAGNRYGMPDEITAARGAVNLWNAFAAALVKAKAKGAKQTTAPVQTSAPAPAAPPAPPPPAEPEPEEPDTGDYDDGEPEPPEGDAPPAAEPRPMPAAERRTEPPTAKPAWAVCVELMHELGVNWAQIRDGVEKGEEIADACGLRCQIDTKIGDLTAAELHKLKVELEARVAEKRARAEKRAASKNAKAGAE